MKENIYMGKKMEEGKNFIQTVKLGLKVIIIMEKNGMEYYIIN